MAYTAVGLISHGVIHSEDLAPHLIRSIFPSKSFA